MDVISQLERIASKKNGTKSDLAVFLLDYKGSYLELKIKDVVEKLHVSSAVTTRLSRDLGFSGFNDLKYSLQKEYDAKKSLNLVKNSSIENYIFEINHSLNNTIRQIDYEQVILSGRMLIESEKILIFAPNEAHEYGRFVKRHLEIHDFDIRFPYEDNDIKHQLNMLKQVKQLVLIIKIDGSIYNYNELVENLNNRNIKTICISTNEIMKPKRGSFILLKDVANFHGDISLSRKISIEAALDLIILEMIKQNNYIKQR